MKRKPEALLPSESPKKDGSDSGTSSSSSGTDDSGSESYPDVSEDEQSSSGDDEDGENYKEINVNFEFVYPKEQDFHGLKALLQTYLDGNQYKCSELVDLILEQVRSVQYSTDMVTRGAPAIAHLQRVGYESFTIQFAWIVSQDLKLYCSAPFEVNCVPLEHAGKVH